MSEDFTARPSKLPGMCVTCRHLNHGTQDNEGGLFLCQVGGNHRRAESTCDVTVDIPPHGTLYLYEPYDGDNGTWAHEGEGFNLATDHLEE